MKKNLYALLILCSYPIALILLILLRIVTKENIILDDTSIKMITFSIIIFSVIKYKDK
jgi:hypothetical protein